MTSKIDLEKNQNTKMRQLRYFSVPLKKKIVRDIERNILTVTEVSREYEVTRSSIYKWIDSFSLNRKKGIRQVIELKSETNKIIEYKNKVRELERMIGQKQLKIDFLEKAIDLAEDEYSIDIKKKFILKQSNGSGEI